MWARIEPGGTVGGEATVPGDKSIAHRWLILAVTARGASVLLRLPPSLDVRATASCLAALSASAAPALEAWAGRGGAVGEGPGFTWDAGDGPSVTREVRVEGEGRERLRPAERALDCANSGTTMRLLAGIVASAPFSTRLVGDESLSVRPMERVAEPLRRMGADVRTADGHAPLEIGGGPLHGIEHRTAAPTAQVKGAVLLAGLAASGETTVEESAPTRDHTERALVALGAPVAIAAGSVTVSAYQHEGFEAAIPGDASSAAFLVAAAGLTGGELVIREVGLNPSRLHFLEVMDRMGIPTETTAVEEHLGEPVGELRVLPSSGLVGTTIEPGETPLVIDEIPVLAAIAAQARGETRFLQTGELRVKEVDRLEALARSIRALGGHAGAEGEDLVVGGGGLSGGTAGAEGDHRMAMALAVGALAASGPSRIEGMHWADVSFPGFAPTLQRLGARVAVER